MKYRTGNPVGTDGSTDPRDMYDNAGNLDLALQSDAPSWKDRFGVDRPTYKEYERQTEAVIDQIVSDGAAAIDTLIMVSAGDFFTGTVVTARNQTVLWSTDHGGNGHEFRWAGALNKTVPAGSSPLTTGGIYPDGQWIDVGVTQLRRDLAPVAGIKHLRKLPNIRQTALSFHDGLGVGGGDYIWLPGADQSEHLQLGPNGGILWASSALELYDGTPGTIVDLLNWVGDGNGCWEQFEQKEVTPELLGLAPGYPLSQLIFSKLISVGKCIDFGGNSKSYLLNEPLETVNKNVYLKGSGCTFNIDFTEQPSGFTPFTFKSSYTSEQIISSISNVLYAFGLAATLVSRLTVAEASAYQVGDPVKVVSEDLIPGLNPANGCKTGESHIVGAIDSVNNYVYLLSTLRESYTLSPRIFKYNRDFKLNIEGEMIFTGNEGYEGTARDETILIEGYFRPFVKGLKGIKLNGEFLSFRGCLKATTENIYAQDLATSSEGNYFGYGIVERSCGYGEHRLPSGINVRHVYTDGATFTPDMADPYGYGRNEHANVYDLVGTDCTNAAADTHAESFGCTFHNPVSLFPHRGADGALWGCQIRGQNATVYDLSTSGGDGLVIRSTYASPYNCRGHRVFGVSRKIKNQETNQSAPIRVLGVSGGRVSDTQLSGIDIDLKIDDGPLCAFEHADVDIFNPNLKAELGGNSTANVFNLLSSKVNVIGGFTDLSGSTGTGIRYSRLRDNDCELTVSRMSIRKGSAALTYMADFDGFNGKGHFTDINFLDAPVSTTAAIDIGSSSDYKLSYTVGGGIAGNSGFQSIVRSANFSLNGLGLDRLVNSSLTVVIDSSGATGDISISDIPNAGVDGQTLTLVHKVSASFNVVIAEVAPGVAIAADIPIPPGRSYTLTSEGGIWLG